MLIVLAASVIASSLISAPYTELVPGDALPVAGLITVPAGRDHPTHGKVLLTDVGVDTLRYTQYFFARLFPNRDNTIIPTGELTSNLPSSEYDAQALVDMAESQLTATAVALRQLGYSVPEHDAGVTIYVIDPNSPAGRTLQVGDVVTSIDGVPTTNPKALQSAVRSHQPGETVTIRVGSISHPTPGHDVSVRLGSLMVNGKKVAFLGIGDPASALAPMGTQPVYDFPFPVSINSDNIGGPSAGLAWTLGMLNKLGGGQLTGGRIVAATGTIRPDGTIGDVGGVQQKTVAVDNAGATVFLVPQIPGNAELTIARAMAGPHLKVFAVSTLAQALSDLESLGGNLGTAAKGPPPGPGGHSVPTDWQDSPWS
ncbi:MAG TPA: PDZ domain-containing protein [Acidimicrobiales bacterium]|nr:PDZ domain-containing protein [Acidimicrobiales bacterium]